MTKRSLIRLAGIIWLAVGIMLMFLGLKFFMMVWHHPGLVHTKQGFSFLKLFPSQPYQTLLLWLIILALAVGYAKGKFVFKKSVTRQITRINKISSPLSLKHLYSPGYYVLMLGMIGLGISLKFLPITLEVRAFVDLAVGGALIQGALHYFRYHLTLTEGQKL
ncbi:MAG: hypothetical protein JSS62_04570 [Verrucomicrobia bacterium]|nr:hypothetical protein [Verrucomicrobiota bacterium]MBS0647045.1 hypothetical protein [Verrucomicrobiota bacterium]